MQPASGILRPIEPRDATLVDLVEAAIEDAIVAGVVREGAALAEAELAAALGVSRSPVRDALKRLAHKGLAESRPRRGMVVAQFVSDEVADFLDLREALEGLAARLAAQRMSEDEIKGVRQHLDAVERQIGAGARGYPSGDDDFHARILRGARSRQLQGTMEAIQARIRLLRRRSGATRERARPALTEHRAILAAIAARDPEAAEAGMRQHIRNARANLIGPTAGGERS